MSAKHVHGLALLCDNQGMIRQVLRNDAHLAGAVPGQLFFRLVDRASRAKAMNFLAEMKTQGAGLDWELNIPVDEDILSLHFAGGQVGDALLITADDDSELAAHMFSDMLSINNEQTNLLRKVLKEKAETARAAPDKDLQQELAALQRELTTKNAEAARLNKLKETCVHMAAHDLRDPLQTILACSAALLEDGSAALDALQKEQITTIQLQSQVLLSLIDDLLDLAATK